MKNVKMLLGDEAFAHGALDAGLSGAYAYPGTPSTEIMEYIQASPLAQTRNIHSHWSANEKTAVEEALGMSFCGKRAIAAMKHVGLNVAADAFVNSAMTGANGGLIVVAADDPSMHSSQNEQDSRFYAGFAMIPVLEPSNQQECYQMAGYGFELSERFRIPVLFRIVTRLAHSRAMVTVAQQASDENAIHYPADAAQWVLMPGNSRRRYPQLIDSYARLAEDSETSPFNKYSDGPDKSIGVIASGLAFNYIMEAWKGEYLHPVLKIGQYPLPVNLIKRIAAECDAVLVVEEGQPVIEQSIKGFFPSVKILGKLSGHLPRTGELTPDNVRAALNIEENRHRPAAQNIVARPPAMCQGCGHRDVYNALNLALSQYDCPKVFGDIGCYTLGYLAPFRAIDTVVDMGASITMAKGASDAGQHPAVAIIGDSTFTHSGMTGLLDAINENSPITVIISDNLTTGMTGGQDSQGTGKLKEISLGLGADPDHIITLNSMPNNVEAMKDIFVREIDYKGLSVIIAARECIQTARRHNKSSK